MQCNYHKKVLNDSSESWQVYSKIYVEEQGAMNSQDTPQIKAYSNWTYHISIGILTCWYNYMYLWPYTYINTYVPKIYLYSMYRYIIISNSMHLYKYTLHK